MPRCPVPETKPVVAGATMSVRTTSTDPSGWPRTRIVSFPPRRTAARSIPNAARPSESVERVSVATPMSGPSGRNETASPGTAFPKESRTVTSSEMGPRAPARTSTWPGCTAATTGPAGPTTTSSGGVPGIDAPEPVTISNVYVAGTRPTGKRNTAVPLASVTAWASCGGPPGTPERSRGRRAKRRRASRSGAGRAFEPPLDAVDIGIKRPVPGRAGGIERRPAFLPHAVVGRPALFDQDEPAPQLGALHLAAGEQLRTQVERGDRQGERVCDPVQPLERGRRRSRERARRWREGRGTRGRVYGRVESDQHGDGQDGHRSVRGPPCEAPDPRGGRPAPTALIGTMELIGQKDPRLQRRRRASERRGGTGRRRDRGNGKGGRRHERRLFGAVVVPAQPRGLAPVGSERGRIDQLIERQALLRPAATAGATQYRAHSRVARPHHHSQLPRLHEKRPRRVRLCRRQGGLPAGPSGPT